MKVTSIYYTETQHEKLKEISTKRGGVKIAELIRRAIDDYIEKEEAKEGGK